MRNGRIPTVDLGGSGTWKRHDDYMFVDEKGRQWNDPAVKALVYQANEAAKVVRRKKAETLAVEDN